MIKAFMRGHASIVVCFMFLTSVAYEYTGPALPELEPAPLTLRDTQGLAIDKYLEENSITSYADEDRHPYTHTVYPADYGGVYLQEDHMVLQVVPNLPTTQTFDFAQSMNIPTQIAKYSMNELNQMMDVITDVITYRKELDIVTAYRGLGSTGIEVGIFEINDEKLKNAQELFEFNPMLTYHNQSMREVVEEVGTDDEIIPEIVSSETADDFTALVVKYHFLLWLFFNS